MIDSEFIEMVNQIDDPKRALEILEDENGWNRGFLCSSDPYYADITHALLLMVMRTLRKVANEA